MVGRFVGSEAAARRQRGGSEAAARRQRGGWRGGTRMAYGRVAIELTGDEALVLSAGA
ncbi:hypothetical protein [Streptomyces sp. CA-253872]|uniref:hypothetical protein n=1 Tax=Streptomyces sp. CA-253872 TaxID=3240067 RepID=UPI003D89D616